MKQTGNCDTKHILMSIYDFEKEWTYRAALVGWKLYISNIGVRKVFLLLLYVIKSDMKCCLDDKTSTKNYNVIPSLLMVWLCT